MTAHVLSSFFDRKEGQGEAYYRYNSQSNLLLQRQMHRHQFGNHLGCLHQHYWLISTNKAIVKAWDCDAKLSVTFVVTVCVGAIFDLNHK
jgi:hypothetical protein